MSEEEDNDIEENGFYEGERQKGQRHGYGSYYFLSGARYTGYWRKGLKHGSGKFIYPDGSGYDGEWWENKKHGYGRYYYPNGDTYDGMWSLDERHGFGLYCDEKRKYYYRGNFFNGQLNGPIFVLMNNIQYSGNFTNGKPEGEGIFTLPNGLKIKGEFQLLGERKTPVWTTKGIETAETLYGKKAERVNNENKDS
ncbi:radial spoke head 1 [Trichonephila clavata]|uniref:Radial spoke head 1 n=1 Tax=Trichonephila clavata TaxID=2740835 RepID=A0A8X6GMY3_TRICU|nr:radial spoke head 1 [Trichonephila clavata]